MKARFMIENVGDIEATLKLTMTVKRWEELRDQLSTHWPSSDLSRAITAVLTDARRVVYADEKEV